MALKCKICQESYDESLRCPRMLTCGHTACEECINNSIKTATQNRAHVQCFFCRAVQSRVEQASDLPKNFTIIELILEGNANSEQFLTCKQHGACMNAVCHSCKLELCSDCIIEGHSEHKFSRQASSGIVIAILDHCVTVGSSLSCHR